jgi:hypothetical protein
MSTSDVVNLALKLAASTSGGISTSVVLLLLRLLAPPALAAALALALISPAVPALALQPKRAASASAEGPRRQQHAPLL